MRLPVWALLSLALALAPDHAFATANPSLRLPKRDVSFGPSVALGAGAFDGVVYGVDVGLTSFVELPWKGLKPVVTTSVNLKALDGPSGQQLGAQVEITTWALVNIGGGFGYLWGPGGGPMSHTFIGIPWAMSDPIHIGPFGTFFIEPFHRYHLLSGAGAGTRTFHEFGVLVKVSTWQ